jgi:hypothetical protein
MEQSNKIALRHAIATSTKTLDVPPGVYPVDATFLIRLRGGVTRHDDSLVTPTASIPFLKVLALALSKVGCTRDAIKTLIIDSVRDALSEKTTALDLDDIQAGVDELRRSFASSLPKVTRKGQTRCSIKAEIDEVIDVSVGVSPDIAADPDIVAVSRVRAG